MSDYALHYVGVDDLYIQNNSQNTSIIPQTYEISSYPWLADYRKNFSKYDEWFFQNYYSWYFGIISNSDSIYTNVAILQKKISMFVETNNWKYSKIYKAIAIEYEPLENYRRKETHKSTRTPNLTTEKNETNTNSVDTTNTGENSESTQTSATIGSNQITSTNTYGTSITETSVNEFLGTASDTPERKETTTKNADENTTNNGARTDSANTSKNSNNTQVLSESEERHGEYSETFSGTDINNEENEIYGNIGVTTSQQMLKEELDVANFNFYKSFFRDMVHELSIGMAYFGR